MNAPLLASTFAVQLTVTYRVGSLILNLEGFQPLKSSYSLIIVDGYLTGCAIVYKDVTMVTITELLTQSLVLFGRWAVVLPITLIKFGLFITLLDCDKLRTW